MKIEEIGERVTGRHVRVVGDIFRKHYDLNLDDNEKRKLRESVMASFTKAIQDEDSFNAFWDSLVAQGMQETEIMALLNRYGMSQLRRQR